jgi:glyoxylase-like metal-dependent hydrolase (beta-lactamase superfamily II)
MPLNLPPPCPNQASHTVQLINTTTDITIPAAGFVSPALPGHETLYLPTFAFLLRHSTTGSLSLFDAGARVDLHNLAPKIVPVVTAEGVHQGTTKGIHTILEEGGVRLESIERLILSHWHYDHVGDPSKFPKSMELVVGEGFKSNFMPGYPTKGDGVMLDSDFEGRNVHEIEFGDMVIGQFRAMDFLGDGSIYLLDVPGVCITSHTA